MYVNSCATSMWESIKMELWVKGSRLKADIMPELRTSRENFESS
jgi:hypothetical protein